MKKHSILGYSVLAILAVLISVVAFAVPMLKTTAFWVSYVFIIIAIAVQVAVWTVAFGRQNTLKSKFFGLPLINIGIIYLIIQMIVFVICLAMPTIPTWIAIIVCVVLLAFATISTISTEVGRDEIERVETKIQQKTSFIKALQVDVEMLADTEVDSETKAALNKLAEQIRFSEPMSCDASAELEKQITDKVTELKVAVDKKSVIKELTSLLAERNRKCKLMK